MATQARVESPELHQAKATLDYNHCTGIHSGEGGGVMGFLPLLVEVHLMSRLKTQQTQLAWN